MEIAGPDVHGDLRGGTEDQFGFRAIDLGTYVIVDRGPGNDSRQLQTLVVIVERGQVQRHLAELIF